MLPSGASKRVCQEVTRLTERNALDRSWGLWLHVPDQADITKLQLFVVGPDDSPYEGGLFEFGVVIEDTYPFVPPRVRFRSPNGAPQIHPNLYATGKVCLSILGTYAGERWAPTMSLETVGMQLRALMMKDSWRCEPGFDTEELTAGGGSSAWDIMVRYNTFVHFVRPDRPHLDDSFGEAYAKLRGRSVEACRTGAVAALGGHVCRVVHSPSVGIVSPMNGVKADMLRVLAESPKRKRGDSI